MASLNDRRFVRGIIANTGNIGTDLTEAGDLGDCDFGVGNDGFLLERVGMGKRKKNVVLPTAGEVFACPLKDGRFGVCRVLRTSTDKESKEFGAASVLVAGSPWIGNELPQEPLEAMRAVLVLTHHAWKGQPHVHWVNDAVPENFVPIGVLEPTSKEQQMKCNSHGGWQGTPLQVLLQWRWDHDRDNLLAEEAKSQVPVKKPNLPTETTRKQPKIPTLRELQKMKFFESWDGDQPVKVIRASRKIMKETVQALSQLNEKATENDRIKILQGCIEAFNQLDNSMDKFIDTILREDICDEFELVANACGLGNRDLADQWRDW